MKDGKPWTDWTIAVTGINSRVENPGPGCAVARCIREHPDFTGRVIGLGYDVLDAGMYHKGLFENGYLLPYPSEGEAPLIDRLQEIDAMERIDAIIPCLDSEMPNFIGVQEELGRSDISMLIPSSHQLTMRSKRYLRPLAYRAGIDTPATRTVNDDHFFDICESEGWAYPLMVKGVFYDASYVTNADQAKAAFHRLVQSWGYPVLVQRVVRGAEFNITAVGDGSGRVYGEVMMRKRAVTDQGKAWAGITVTDGALTDLTGKIVKSLNWSGPLEVELIIADDGYINLIEINPRFPSWIYLSHGAGRNLPVTLLRLMAGERDFDFPPPKSGVLFVRHAQELIVELLEFESVFVKGSSVPKQTA